jgi:predicted metalloendopeptidase
MNSKVYRATISAPQLTLYDYVLYIEDTEDDEDTAAHKRKFKRAYLQFVTDCFALVEGGKNDHRAEDVWDAEVAMLSAMGCNRDKRDREDGYNLIRTADSMERTGLDWPQLAEKIGYTAVPDQFVCTSTNYLQCMMATLEEKDAWKSKQWRTYFLYIVYRQLMRFHKGWRKTYYEFHGKFVHGQPVIWPDDLYPVFGLSMCFNTFLTKQYVSRNYNQEYVTYTQTMCEDLLTTFKTILGRNQWLTKSTKASALLKLTNMKLIIGEPAKLRDDPILPYERRGAYQNMLKIAHWRAKQMIEVDGTTTDYDIPVIDWNLFKLVGKQSYVVNAYYTPSENSIYVPLAYLQKPFIDLRERGLEYNLAYIGYTLAHEMSHSLDDMGSKYDHLGNMVDWWTPEDRRKFNHRVQNVIKQYETFAAYDGIKMDASLSTGENMADIAGLAICIEHLMNVQAARKDITPIRSLSFESFFTYVAVQSRQKIYDKAIEAQLATNPHPMNKYRTNCPLARMPTFKTIYNIGPKDKMYWEGDGALW